MKKSERVLLGVFAALFTCILLAGGGVFAVRQYLDVRDEVDLLRDRLGAMNLAISQGEVWAQRHAWMDANAPRFSSNKDACARLLESVTRKAGAHGLNIGATEFIEHSLGGTDAEDALAEEEAHFDKACVKITLTGVAEEPFFAWLHEVQAPASFLGITRLQMNPSGTNKTVNVEVEFTQFYHEKITPKVTKAGQP